MAAITIYGSHEKYTEFWNIYIINMAYWENDIKTILLRHVATIRDEQDLSGL
jgi:hypothetical protein